MSADEFAEQLITRAETDLVFLEDESRSLLWLTAALQLETLKELRRQRMERSEDVSKPTGKRGRPRRTGSEDREISANDE